MFRGTYSVARVVNRVGLFFKTIYKTSNISNLSSVTVCIYETFQYLTKCKKIKCFRIKNFKISKTFQICVEPLKSTNPLKNEPTYCTSLKIAFSKAGYTGLLIEDETSETTAENSSFCLSFLVPAPEHLFPGPCS